MTHTEIQQTMERDFYLRVLGRTLGHLGKQLYKRRDLAIVELVANCWDAQAQNVWIEIPDESAYSKTESTYVIMDDGIGMSDADVENAYLVVGRNRREDEDGLYSGDRRVMGRKGVGKLAAFGMATRMRVETWRTGEVTSFLIDYNLLKTDDGEAERKRIRGEVWQAAAYHGLEHGTRLTLSELSHKAPLDPESLKMALSRRFSRVVRGRMNIFVNGQQLAPVELNLVYREPSVDSGMEFVEEQLSDGNTIRYYAGYTESSIPLTEMRGFAIYVNEKTAQSPPFFFDVERTASGQHGTKYVHGEIYADYLDDSVEDDKDLVSTDRQEIDWEGEEAEALLEWGKQKSRRLLAAWARRKVDRVNERISATPEMNARLLKLDKASQQRFERILKQLGETDAETDQMWTIADSLLRIFEYQHFHDITEQIDLASAAGPDELLRLLSVLGDWKVLESRAILEIVHGRLRIIDKFKEMIVNDAPETAPSVGADNMHDLIAGYPWLLRPEWQVLIEERGITKILRDWGAEVANEEMTRKRLDFLALADESRLVVVEIKRSGHACSDEEVRRAMSYTENLRKGTTRSVSTVVIASQFNISDEGLADYNAMRSLELRSWGELHDIARGFYDHYRSVLEGNVNDPGFARKEAEVQATRNILQPGGSYRTPEQRSQGLGDQSVAEALIPRDQVPDSGKD